MTKKPRLNRVRYVIGLALVCVSNGMWMPVVLNSMHKSPGLGAFGAICGALTFYVWVQIMAQRARDIGIRARVFLLTYGLTLLMSGISIGNGGSLGFTIGSLVWILFLAVMPGLKPYQTGLARTEERLEANEGRTEPACP